ncbi:hypothetical protein P7G51_04120 [Enterococcus asini]|uniref:hypothetical protein n=1 Tax=Enterococcus asini TaxID=57732 RepID=UPI00288D64AC|nr:hypothetical protein [Enterococcus asini]MDT2756569.1 hypothetical protein [Enterococcus asini]
MKNELHPYQDRKKLKWNGFYLSEHTSQLAKEKQVQDLIWPQKPLMTSEEIGEVLKTAQQKNRPIVLQKEELDQEGHYLPDITGNVQGFDELGIFVANEKVHYDEIRHIALGQQKKWSDLSS